ncbi:MAG TPA: anti-sigma factor [Blattabacteriaceae bacterium]|nr:anti-sigma factor [Blattabacteriaceae bacterium]
MNAHPQFAEALALYAMGALDNPQDLAALESHLGTCGDCRRELEALRADTALLALSATGPQPPARSRQRLLTAIAAEPRVERRTPQRYAIGRLRRRWVTIAPVMMMAMLAVFSILLWRDLRNTRRTLRHTHAQLEQVQSELARTNKDLAEAKMIRDLMHAPDAWPLTLVSRKTPPQPQIKTVYSKQQGALLLMASNLTPLPENKIYQVWLLPTNGGAPMSAGWFKPDSKGNGMMFHKMASADISAKGFAVTIENAGGSQTPTMPIVMEPAG